jgi:putative hydroxymethylpyrimidine transport system substrate-binding protein
MPLNRRSFLAGSLGMAGAISAAQSSRAQGPTKASIALDWYPNANHAGLFWAQSAGLFTDAGVDISIETPADPTTVLQTVAAGRDTFGISYQPDILLARAQDLPVVAVCAIVPRPLQGVVSLKSADIARPSDLRGKTVGFPGIPSQEAFLKTMLAADGVAMDEITLNNVEFNLLPTLISGQAAAVMGAFWTHETIVAELEGYPVEMMKVEDWGVPLYDELVLVTSEETLATKREMVTGALEVIRAGYMAAAADQTQAIDILVAAYPETERPVEEQGIALLADLWTQPDPGFGIMDPDAWAKFADWMIEHDLLPAGFELADTIGANLPAQPSATPTG